MSERERFLKIAKSDLKGELFLPYNLNYGWFMEETMDRWKKEGMPEEVNPLNFFGFDRIKFTGGNPYGLIPPFDLKVISEDEDTRVICDELGITKKVFKKYEDSKMPQWLDFPIKCRRDFKEFKRRLNPHSSGRYPANWENLVKGWKKRDFPLGIAAGSFWGHTLRNWIGVEKFCFLFYDDPNFIHEMMEYLEDFFLELIKKAVKEVDFDFASFGEDIGFKTASFISPKMFKDFILPHYVRVCRFLRENGIEVIFVDSDGNIEELIPLWLKVGVNGFSPLEVAAGMDAISLKEKYGKDIVLAGNIDKRTLISSIFSS